MLEMRLPHPAQTNLLMALYVYQDNDVGILGREVGLLS